MTLTLDPLLPETLAASDVEARVQEAFGAWQELACFPFELTIAGFAECGKNNGEDHARSPVSAKQLSCFGVRRSP